MGNGYLEGGDDFGIGFVGSPRGNVIEANTISGNTNGVYVPPGAADNVVRENVIVGNPAIQTSNSRPDAQSVDILNLAPAGRNTFERNVCLTSVNAPCPGVTGGRPLKEPPP